MLVKSDVRRANTGHFLVRELLLPIATLLPETLAATGLRARRRVWEETTTL
jgi:hypothetical protein